MTSKLIAKSRFFSKRANIEVINEYYDKIKRNKLKAHERLQIILMLLNLRDACQSLDWREELVFILDIDEDAIDAWMSELSRKNLEILVHAIYHLVNIAYAREDLDDIEEDSLERLLEIAGDYDE